MVPAGGAQRGTFYDLIALARIVGRINVDDALRPHPMQLDDGVLGEPSIMLHTFWCAGKPPGLKSISLFLIKLVTHSDVKCP